MSESPIILTKDEETLIYLMRKFAGPYVDFEIETRGGRITRVIPKVSCIITSPEK